MGRWAVICIARRRVGSCWHQPVAESAHSCQTPPKAADDYLKQQATALLCDPPSWAPPNPKV
eukprot:5479502-Alexandrium_andersonii.AAC.1